MRDKQRVLFVCTGASCRSQMAAGWALHLAGDRLEAYSAGTDPKGLHPLAIRAMGEVGIDIADRRSASVFDFLDDPPDHVITVCSEAGRNCPEFPAYVPTLRWSFEDPAAARGPEPEVFDLFRRVRDEIRDRLTTWIDGELVRAVGR